MEPFMNFTVKSLDHVEVFVSDTRSAARWYEEVLGLKEITRWDPEPVMIGAGGTKVALFQMRTSGTPPAGELKIDSGWRRVAWLTDAEGFKLAQSHLANLGVRFAGPQDHGQSHSIYFADPDGNPLEITYYLSE
jgi:catechol-2,3-dioxygenase